MRRLLLLPLLVGWCLPAFGAAGMEAVYQLIASQCVPQRGGGARGTAFATTYSQNGASELRFITALHVVIGCEDLALYLEKSDGHEFPTTTVKVVSAYVDFRRDLAALTLADPGTERYFQGIRPFRLASRPPASAASETVTIMYYSNNSYRRDQRPTIATIWPPLELKDITQNIPAFAWNEFRRGELNFLDTTVIRLPGVAWPGFSGAPLAIDGAKEPVALGVVDGAVHDRLQWAIPAWDIQWQPAQNTKDLQGKLLALASRIHLFSEAPTRDEERNGTMVRFIGLPPRLLGGREDVPFLFVQEAELSNAQARAYGSKVNDSSNPRAPFVMSRIADASKICADLHAELLHVNEYRLLMENAFQVDPQACFSNLGDAARDRGCKEMAAGGGNGAELDITASVAYGPADEYPNHLGLRNLIGNAWEWSSEGVLVGGAADTVLAGRDAAERAAKLVKKKGEGTVRCVQRH